MFSKGKTLCHFLGRNDHTVSSPLVSPGMKTDHQVLESDDSDKRALNPLRPVSPSLINGLGH